MGFWSNFRSFLRTREEILNRIEAVEREVRTLRHDHDEVDDFVHRLSRKRYQDDYVPKEPTEVNQSLPLPFPAPPLSKQQLRERAKARLGYVP